MSVREATVLFAVFVGAGAAAALLVLAAPGDHRIKVAPSATMGAGPIVGASSAEETVLAPIASVTASGSQAPSASAARAPAAPPTRGDCPDDMALVEGWWCPFVAHRCDKERPARAPGEPATCDRYRAEVLCEGALEWARFCVDRFEYPNVPGMRPAVLATFDEAASACDTEGKRLCTVREWTFACEGEAMAPYPHGVERGAGVCQLDAGPEARVAPSTGPTVAGDLERVDRRAPIGAHPACASPFGALDLAGNVSEWTTDPTGGRARPPFVSVVSGGAWGDGPSTCRTLDPAVVPAHRGGALGFRCCSEAAPRRDPVPPVRERRGGFQPIRAVGAPGLP
jgi:sulfatase modifying factor 1